MLSFNMKEVLIFFFLFLIVFSFSLFIFNGRFIYAQLKYHFLGPSPINLERVSNEEDGSHQIPQRIVILSLGIDAPIIWPEDNSENSLQNALEKGVAFWPESALLGERGTIIILGHSSAYPWYKGNYGSIFSLINKLNPGDEIFLFSQNNKYTYQVIEKEIQMPANLNIANQNNQSILYILSCWPINTNWKRIAVKAIAIDNN